MTMQKFIPFEKLSKKQQREQNAKKRNTWGELNPVTRKAPDKTKYNRKRAQQDRNDFYSVVPFIL